MYVDRSVYRTHTRASLCVLLLLLAGCGSQLEPEEVRRLDSSSTDASSQPALTRALGAPGPDGAAQRGPAAPSTGDDAIPPAGTIDPDNPSSVGEVPLLAADADDDQSNDTPRTSDEAPACSNLEDAPGITSSTLTIGNTADVSGPIPGLFQSSQQATQAFVSYFNATRPDGICGRRLEIKNYDSRTDASADQQAYAAACTEVFAMVGSMSAFDSGGAAAAQQCGLPDLRSAAVTQARARCSTCFGAQSTNSNQFQNAVPDFARRYHARAGQHAAMLFIDAGAAAENAPKQVAAMEKRGMDFDYVQPIDISEFNYAPYVQQMKDREIEWVQMVGATASIASKLVQTMAQNNYRPEVFMVDPTTYDPAYVELAGEAGEGTRVFINFTPFEDADPATDELNLYLAYLDQVAPGANPSFFGLFSWSAARLFTNLVTDLGDKLTRASLLSALRRVEKWTANGLHSPQNVGTKQIGDCWRIIILRNGTWQPDQGANYSCTGTTTVP